MTHDIPPLADDLRALVERASVLELAPAAAKANVLARVEAIVGAPGASGAGPAAGREGRGSFQDGNTPARRTVRSSGASLPRRLLPLVASFALGSSVTALVLQRRPAESQTTTRFVYVDRPASVLPTTEPSATSANSSTLTQAPPSTAPATPAQRSVSRNQFAAERQLLDLARAALEREDAEAALQATSRHERAYPNGALVQEREAMAIRALALSGRSAEARARADAFRAHFPESLLLPTVESIVGAAP
jgi:hypothetical protein